jgi:hypothetical protein
VRDEHDVIDLGALRDSPLRFSTKLGDGQDPDLSPSIPVTCVARLYTAWSRTTCNSTFSPGGGAKAPNREVAISVASLQGNQLRPEIASAKRAGSGITGKWRKHVTDELSELMSV